MQVVFCSIFYFASINLFPGFLIVGYATVYTMYPVFSLVLDKDVSADIAMTYPELYKDLTKVGHIFKVSSVKKVCKEFVCVLVVVGGWWHPELYKDLSKVGHVFEDFGCVCACLRVCVCVCA